MERELPYWPRLGNWGIGFADAELFALHGDREFQAIVEQIEAKMARELENLETMAEGA